MKQLEHFTLVQSGIAQSFGVLCNHDMIFLGLFRFIPCTTILGMDSVSN